MASIPCPSAARPRSFLLWSPRPRRIFRLLPRPWVVLLLLAGLALGLALPAGAGEGGRIEGELIVRFKAGASLADIQARLASLDLALHAVLAEPAEARGRFIVLVRSERLTAGEMSALLVSDPLVDQVSANTQRKRRATPNDPGFASQWGMANTGQKVGGATGTAGEDVKAKAAWDVTTGSSEVVVAVADSGVQYDHPDLLANMWVNPNPHVDGTYDGTYGANFAADNSGATSDDPRDLGGHGTHCAGIVAAVGNNGAGVAGVAWTARIMAVKLERPNSSYVDSDVLRGISYILKKKRRGVNIVAVSASFGGPSRNQLVLDQIVELGRAGIVWVGAAGNDALNNDVSPLKEFVSSGDAPSILSVAAANSTGSLAPFSHFGRRTVDLAAPGVNINSTYINATYKLDDGTSMATPHVSGCLALLAARYPAETAWTRIRRVLSTTDSLPGLSGKVLTGGRLNVQSALAAAPTLWPLVANASVVQGLVPGASLTLNGFGFGASSGSMVFEDLPGTRTTASPSSWTDDSATGSVPNGAGRFVRVQPGSGNGSNYLEVTAWAERATASSAHAAPVAAVWNGRLLLFGGLADQTTATAASEVYDPQANAWTSLAAMPQARAFGAGAVLGGTLYAFGGSTPSARIGTADRYDLAAGTWSTCNSATALNATAAGVVAGTAYVAGGSSATGILTTDIRRFTPATCAVATVANLNTARHRHTAVGLGDSLYVFGGQSANGRGIADLEVYNVTAGTVTARSMPWNMTDAWAVALNRTIVLATGFIWNASSPTAQTYSFEYAPSTNTWTNKTGTINEPMRKRVWAAVGQMPGRGLLVAGGWDPGADEYLKTVDFLALPPTLAASAVQPLAGQTATVLGQSALFQSEAELGRVYGFPSSTWEKYSDPLAFNATVGLAGELAAFEYAFTPSRSARVGGTALFKLNGGSATSRSFSYAAGSTDFRDGSWWLGETNGTYLGTGQTLAANRTYVVHLCLRDNGPFDLDPALGRIQDPTALGVLKSTGGGGGGCLLDPWAGAGLEWLLLPGLAGLGLLRRRLSPR